jgi:hypothetical protein
MAEAVLEDHIRRHDMPKSTFASPSSTVEGRKVEKVFQGNNAEPDKEQEKGDILRAALAKPESASHPQRLRQNNLDNTNAGWDLKSPMRRAHQGYDGWEVNLGDADADTDENMDDEDDYDDDYDDELDDMEPNRAWKGKNKAKDQQDSDEAAFQWLKRQNNQCRYLRI